MNVKVISTLVSMAVVSFMFFIVALFHVEPLHAQTILMETVAIEDGSLRPIAVDLKPIHAKINVSASATTTAHTTEVKVEEKDGKIKIEKDDDRDDQNDISSTTDLDTYTRTITVDDSNVSKVVVKDDSVAVSYQEPAKIFGIIPTEVTVTAQVNNDGTVTIKYPWYVFLKGKNDGQLKPGLQLKIGQILQTASTTYATTTNATSTKLIQEPKIRALLIHALQSALRDFRMSATTTASTSGSISR